MRKTLRAGITIICCIVGLVACATTYRVYSVDLFEGKKLLARKDYQGARAYFEQANRAMPDSVSATYLAVVAYKTGDLETAQRWIGEALKEKPDQLCVFRTYGYRALIYLKRDRKTGMIALKDYIDRYGTSFPLESIDEVKRMWEGGNIDEARLEKLIEEQIEWYEKEMEQYLTSHTGFFARDARGGESVGR